MAFAGGEAGHRHAARVNPDSHSRSRNSDSQSGSGAVSEGTTSSMSFLSRDSPLLQLWQWNWLQISHSRFSENQSRLPKNEISHTVNTTRHYGHP